MDNGQPPTTTQNASTQPDLNTGYVDIPNQNTNELSGTPVIGTDFTLQKKKKFKKRIVLISAVLVAVLLISSLILWAIGRSDTAVQQRIGKFGPLSVPLQTLASTDTGSSGVTVTVNGRLQVTDSIILSPSAKPNNPVAGQLYYDKTTNQLSYYNGQQFVGMGGTGAGGNITNITTGQSAGTAVLLQSASPGEQQTGNLNISGKAKVGELETTVIRTGGRALIVGPLNPGTIISPDPKPGTNVNLGLTTLGAYMTGDVHGTFIATRTTVGNVGGIAKTITVYIQGGSSSKHIQLGLYDDDGDIPSRPNALLAVSASTNIKPNSYNTLTIPSTSLSANTTYWMAFNTDDPTAFRSYDGGAKQSCFYGLGYGFMPNPFGVGGCFFSNEVYTMYLTYTAGSGSTGTAGQALFTISGTGQALFQNSEDSTSAFQVQNAIGTNTIFNVDTLNGRVGIGKSTPSYKLDIASGDINLNSGYSLRFGGVPTLSVTNAGINTKLVNPASTGNVLIQANTVTVQDASGDHNNLAFDSSGKATFSNRTNSTTGFQIQNATGVSLLTADTTNMSIKIGSSAGSSTPVLLYLANKNTAGDPVGGEGALYYNSTLGSFRCFYSGFWQNCADIEPQHSFSLYDEFVGGQTSFTGGIGNLGWNALAIGANGALALNPATPAPSADRPGVLHLQTPAVINQGSTLLLGDSSGGSLIIAKDNDMKTGVAVGSTTDQVLRVGLHNETTSTSQPLSGIWWEADPATSAYWRYCYGNGAAASCAASTVAIAANTWVTLEIRVTATGNGTSAAYFVINSTSYQATATTIDTTNRVSPAYSCYAAAGSAQSCYWDYFHLTGTTAAAR